MNEIISANQMKNLETKDNTMTVASVRDRVIVIQEVMKSLMKEDVHFGVIPYTKNPTLYKAGAELLLMTFRISPMPKVEDLSSSGVIRYRVICEGVHQVTGQVVGCGMGECSSNEEKYKWRASVCDAEYEDTPVDEKRVKYARGKGGGHYTTKQVRTNCDDQANTILKMADKRALVAMCRTSLAVSDIFDQDIEDLAPENLQSAPAGVAAQQTQATPEKQKLMDDLTVSANEGMESLTGSWGRLSDDDRKIVGADFGTLKKIAAAV